MLLFLDWNTDSILFLWINDYEVFLLIISLEFFFNQDEFDIAFVCDFRGGGIGGGNTNVQDKQNIDINGFFLIYKLINICVCSEFFF